MSVSDVQRPRPPQPIVSWFPPAGPLRNVSSELGGPLTLAIGAFATIALVAGAVLLTRRAFNPELKALKVDKLVVRRITVLENAARYQ